MIRAVMDTSSLVSLSLISALEKSLEVCEIFIPKEVLVELKDLYKYPDKEGKSSKKITSLIRSNRIKMIRIKDKKSVRNLLSSAINEGEASCFVCCLENNIKTLIMDDIDAAYRLEGLALSKGIKMKISVAVLVELFRQKKITKKQLISFIEKMVKIRKWEGGALEVLMKKYLEKI